MISCIPMCITKLCLKTHNRPWLFEDWVGSNSSEAHSKVALVHPTHWKYSEGMHLLWCLTNTNYSSWTLLEWTHRWAKKHVNGQSLQWQFRSWFQWIQKKSETLRSLNLLISSLFTTSALAQTWEMNLHWNSLAHMVLYTSWIPLMKTSWNLNDSLMQKRPKLIFSSHQFRYINGNFSSFVNYNLYK